MLGKIIGRRPWCWASFGKHPSARDYFQIQLDRPLALAFAKWTESGFGRMDEKDRRIAGNSWRFWSRGVKKGTLSCGLCKSSADGIGRPYPLMLIGEGTLDGWEKNWHLLPFLLAPVWERLEYISARRVEHISQMEADLQRMETPSPDWKRVLGSVHDSGDASPDSSMRKVILSHLQEKAETLSMERRLALPLDTIAEGDPLQMAGAWHQGIKQCFSGPPNTVFMGGSPQKPFVVFYTRPLSIDDFMDLWSL